MHLIISLNLASAFVLLCSTTSSAALVHFTNKSEWENAVNGYSTIDFTGHPNGTQIVDQYVSQGVLFKTPTFIHISGSYVNDGIGLHGPFGIGFTFASPQQWVAIDHAGPAQFQLFFQGALIATSDLFPIGGTGNFSGLVSTVAFDEVLIFRPWPIGPNTFIDDLHWGAIPAPGVGAALLGWFAIGRRRRWR